MRTCGITTYDATVLILILVLMTVALLKSLQLHRLVGSVYSMYNFLSLRECLLMEPMHIFVASLNKPTLAPESFAVTPSTCNNASNENKTSLLRAQMTMPLDEQVLSLVPPPILSGICLFPHCD